MTLKIANLPQEMKAIRKTIERYECDDSDKKALARIVSSKSALEALVEMQLTDAQLKKVMFSFIQAANVSQKFKLILAREATMPRRLEKLGKAVTDLRTFVSEVSDPPEDSLSAWISIDAADKDKWLQALYEITSLIRTRGRIARETPRRIGATRKLSSKVAQENAGIGWLAASIKRICGRPYDRQTRRLAEVLFGIREISEDRLRRALRNHTEHEWRIS